MEHKTKEESDHTTINHSEEFYNNLGIGSEACLSLRVCLHVKFMSTTI